MDTGHEAIVDELIRAQVRRQARQVHLRAIALAIVLTAGALALPVG